MFTYYIMHSACMQARYNHMNLVHTRHQSRMYLVCYIDYVYLASCTRTSRRDYMNKTRCYTRMITRMQSRSLGTWDLVQVNLVHCYYTDHPLKCQAGLISSIYKKSVSCKNFCASLWVDRGPFVC